MYVFIMYVPGVPTQNYVSVFAEPYNHELCTNLNEIPTILQQKDLLRCRKLSHQNQRYRSSIMDNIPWKLIF